MDGGGSSNRARGGNPGPAGDGIGTGTGPVRRDRAS
jgi:hypothetical protein